VKDKQYGDDPLARKMALALAIIIFGAAAALIVAVVFR
jgi:hypothetical protein